MLQKERDQPRKIIHVDCDCFYDVVEIRENPDLHGTIIAAGGRPAPRGVIATCSYEARRYPIWLNRSLCLRWKREGKCVRLGVGVRLQDGRESEALMQTDLFDRR